jgi:hypothetical protein
MRGAGSRGSLPGAVRPPSEHVGTIGRMRRLLTWLVVSLGIAALIRRLRRSSRPVESAPVGAGTAEPAADDDPADELRRKLADSRAEDEPAADPSSPVTVEERRAEIHGQGRSALEEMRETDEG